MATYNDLLALHTKFKIHQRHFHFRAIEMYKSRNILDSSFMWKADLEKKNIPYSLRRGVHFLVSDSNTRKHGIIIH